MKDLLRTRWAAVGAAVAVTLGAGGFSLTQAAISTGEKPVYVSLDSPCRVVDTRDTFKIGPGDDASLDVQITGENGKCTGPLVIPADAVGVSTNVTVIQPSDAATGRSYFTVYPTGAARPVTSNLNFVNGQAPTPNKVDVGIGTGGKITIYNNEGSAHAAVDIFGYYVDHTHDDRYYTKAEADARFMKQAPPIVLMHSTSALEDFTDQDTVASYGRGAELLGSYAQLDISGPISLDGVRYRLDSITYCVWNFTGNRYINMVRLNREGLGPTTGITDDTDRHTSDCYTVAGETLEPAFSYDIQFEVLGTTGSIRLSGVQSTWVPSGD